MKKLVKYLIYILPLTLFFSYYPVIHFGASESMNFEISLPIIWLVIFDLVTFILLIKQKMLLKDFRKKWVWLLLPAFLSASVLWSLNSLRGLLTVGILWLTYFAINAMISLKSWFDDEFKAKFWKWLIGSTLVVCGWCLVQCILDLVGVGREQSLLCQGCTYRSFGFPHPNGFAIEPQFMGNLLLAPAIALAWFTSGHSRKALIAFAIIVVTLFLTFSRGAIYAFIVAMIFMTGFLIVRREKLKRIGLVWLTIVLAFLFTLNLQGIMAAVSPTNDTYVSGVTKVLNHLSLGIIDIREKAPEIEVESVEKPVENSAFDGYVPESTETRVKLTNTALSVWAKEPGTVMFGVGLGGAGQALYVNGLTDSPKEIVQNQYASLLLETGLIGVFLLVLTLVLIVKIVIKRKNVALILALMVAYGVSLLFFAGLPNALQIYLILPIIALVSM